ncbi:MAG: hypothetical protein GXO03_05245 [Aquificae bacterium]|nr:hypothetical protein [Aquificota bacterium]
MRLLLLLLFASYLFALEPVKLWEHFKREFIKEEGFVVDPYNGYRVTSEAQGYAMTLAVLLNDRETFYRLWRWTEENLRRPDGLFAWLWAHGEVLDDNNATDADLFIGYALLLASERWKDEALLKEAERVLRQVKKLVLPFCTEPKALVLLPGKRGFIKERGALVKLSYYVPFIFKKLGWRELYRQSYELYLSAPASSELFFDFLDKRFVPQGFIDADGMRALVYAYADGPERFKSLKASFKPLYAFYRKHGYLPGRLTYPSKAEGQAPFCFYYFLGKLFNDEGMLEKFRAGLKYDEKNYYCYALLLLAAAHR